MLLDDIIDLATDNKQSITVLLRKCLILASQLKSERLKEWANKELNGYPSVEDIPPYRIKNARAKGSFSGPAGMFIQHRNIPSVLLEEKHRRWAETVYLGQAISAYEDAIKLKGDRVSIPWDNNLILHYQGEFIDDFALVSAWQEVAKSGLVELLDTIRNRILNLALELKSDIGESDADLKRAAPQQAQKVDQSIITNIYGGNVYVATGESTMNASTIQQQQQNIVVGDWEHLAKVLRNAGLSQPELDELSTAVKEDGQTMGSKVKGWIAKTAPKVLSGGVKIGASVGQGLLLEYLKQYYGL